MTERNTYIPMTMESGKEVQLTLNFYRLYLLKTNHKEEYDAYFKIESKGSIDEIDVCHQIYTAYLCATMDDEEREYPTFESFLMDLPESRNLIFSIYGTLIGRKKKKPIEKRSGTSRETV